VTIDECRDRIAVLLGWRREVRDGIHIWTLDGPSTALHPVPDTIDQIAVLWPKGWYWIVSLEEHSDQVIAQAWKFRGGMEVAMCQTEYEARLRLLLAVLEKEKADA